MADIELIKQVGARQPRMNAEICNGIASIHMNSLTASGRTATEQYIHDVWEAASQSFPEGLRYLGDERCTPFEEWREITRPMKPYRSFDLTESDTYLMKYRFSFNGQEIRPRYIFLPYPRDGDLLFLGGTRYKITPVIGGRAFNIEYDRIFLPSPRARLIFCKTQVTYVLNNHSIGHANAVSSPLYNVSSDESIKSRDTLLVHYMLAEYGLSEMMKRYYDTEVKVGGIELDGLVDTGEWFVYKSLGRPPAGVRSGYTPTNIRIAIPAEKHSPVLNSIIGGVFYILDHFPEAMEPGDVDNPEYWLRLLSRFIFKTTDAENKMFEEMLTHRRNICRYMDGITRQTLKREGVNCETIYDLFHYMNLHFDDMLIHNDLGSMYNQELTTVKHIVYDIVYNIFILMFNLQKLSGERVNADTITKHMDKLLRRDNIYKVTKHAEVTADAIAANCKPFNATCNTISQAKVSMAGKKSNKHGGGMADEASLLHASQTEVGSIQMMTKADATGRSKLNPFVFFGQPDYIQANPALEETIEKLQKQIKG